MENITIVKVTLAELDKLIWVSRATFSEAFSDTNSAEDMEHYLTDSFSAAQLTEELNNTQSSFYFAVLNNNIIGYLKTNTDQAQTEIKDKSALEIERIYVFKAYHGKKVGQLLYQHAISKALEIDAAYVWLGVWEKNERAIAFYTKNGFVQFDQHLFKLGNDIQTDLMMKKMLKA